MKLKYVYISSYRGRLCYQGTLWLPHILGVRRSFVTLARSEEEFLFRLAKGFLHG